MPKRALPIVKYNQFLKSSKSRFSLNHRKAQVFYRGFKARLDKIPRVADLSAHPRVARQEAKRAASKRIRKPRSSGVSEPTRVSAGGGAGGGGEVIFGSEILDEEYIPDYEGDFVDIEGDEDVYG